MVPVCDYCHLASDSPAWQTAYAKWRQADAQRLENTRLLARDNPELARVAWASPGIETSPDLRPPLVPAGPG